MSNLTRWLEHWFVLPFRWLRAHRRVWREGLQRCKSCGQADGFNFTLPVAVWLAIVPPKYQNRVVCLYCLDRFAKAKGIDYKPYLSELCFAGDQASLQLTIGG